MNTKDVEMIFAEANLLKNLNHKHIVKINECFTFNDLKAYFIMEYLPGVNLSKLGRFITIYQQIAKLMSKRRRMLTLF